MLAAGCSKEAVKPAENTFIKFYGSFNSNVGYAMDLTSDNGYVIAGTNSTISDGSQIYVLKTDYLGNTVWSYKSGEKSYGNDYGKDVKVVENGLVVLCDISFNKVPNQNPDFDSTDIHLIRLDASGTLIKDANLSVVINNKHLIALGHSLQQTADKGFVIASELRTSATTSETYLVKTDADFNILWTRRYGSNFLPTEVRSMLITETEDILWAGADYRIKSGQSDARFGDFRLTKTNKDGGIIFDRTYTNFSNGYLASGNDQANDIKQTKDGFISVGFTNETNLTATNNDDSQMTMVSLFPNGTPRWDISFGGTSKDKAEGVYVTEDVNFVVIGTYTDSEKKQQIYLNKFDPNGVPLWEKRLFGGSGNDQGKAVRPTPDGGYILLGTAEQTGIQKICLIKTNSEGRISD